MARISNLFSKAFVDDTAHQAGANRRLVALGLAAAVTLGTVTAALAAGPAPKQPVASVVALKVQKDPLAGDVWHAMNSSWPGTIVFDSAKKTVTLTPVGATPMEATYTFTVKSTTDKATEGTLRMTNAEKQVSESTFRIEGKNLVLSFGNGLRSEQYVKMTPQEEAAEKARLEKMISEGRIRPLR